MTFIRSSFKIGILLLFLRILTAKALNDAPCNYSDTVALDPSTFGNGSYIYEGIRVPKDQTGIYTYEIEEGNQTIPTEEHVRGCICKFRACISICCVDGEYHNEACKESIYSPETHISIANRQGKIVSVDIFEQFAVQYYRPCKGLYYLQPQQILESNFSILENGSLHKFEENRLLDKNSYCLSPMVHNGNRLIYTPLQCYAPNPVNVDELKINAMALLISVPFMILTIIVYLSLKGLRNSIHGLCLCCYLGGLSVGYATLAYLFFEKNENISSLGCSILGYTIYFAFMSAFFWLSVISFDLYSCIHGSEAKKMKIFRLYSLYAWGLALICLICTYIAQNSTIVPTSWKSGIGSRDFCFLNAISGWSAMIYFYGPILIIVSVNTVLFVLTFMQMRKRVQLASYDGVLKPHNEHRALCIIFLRLFIVMGITWLAEALSYMTPRGSWLHNIFKITDLLNAIQGVIIFFVFVVFRKSVRNQLLKKFRKSDELPGDQTLEMTQCL